MNTLRRGFAAASVVCFLAAVGTGLVSIWSDESGRWVETSNLVIVSAVVFGGVYLVWTFFRFMGEEIR